MKRAAAKASCIALCCNFAFGTTTLLSRLLPLRTSRPLSKADHFKMTFYTYMWLREDGTPYYVGKGHGARAIRKGSPSLDRILIQEFESEADAFAAEVFLIAHY